MMRHLRRDSSSATTRTSPTRCHPTMVRSRLIITVASSLAFALPCLAAAQAVVPDALQQEALSCAGEAMQVCPEIWMAEDHGLACMAGKRAVFSPRCRIVYDKVVHALKR